MNDDNAASSAGDAALWAAVSARLACLESLLAGDGEGDPAALEQQLRERTAYWAEPEAVAAAQAPFEVLGFSLGDECYGIVPHFVAEVVPLRQFTPLPGTPPFVLGIVNLRGRIVSVLDLRVLFEIPRRGLSERNHLVLLQHDDMEFGVLADAILGMQWVSPQTLQPELVGLSGILSSCLLGITPQQWVILDGAKLLGNEQLQVEFNT